MAPWRAPIGQWGSGFVPTDSVAHWCVIGHCVGIMAAHVVSQVGVLPSPIPPTAIIINTDGRKGRQKIP